MVRLKLSESPNAARCRTLCASAIVTCLGSDVISAIGFPIVYKHNDRDEVDVTYQWQMF